VVATLRSVLIQSQGGIFPT